MTLMARQAGVGVAPVKKVVEFLLWETKFLYLEPAPSVPGTLGPWPQVQNIAKNQRAGLFPVAGSFLA